MKSAADIIRSRNCFELRNCETTETEKKVQPEDKDTSIVSSDTRNHYPKYEPEVIKKEIRPEVIANKFPEIQNNFQTKKYWSG